MKRMTESGCLGSHLTCAAVNSVTLDELLDLSGPQSLVPKGG